MMSQQSDSKGGDNVSELKDAFKVFDQDGDGSITANEIASVMGALGEKLSLETCKLMISSVDLDKNGCIDFEEFRQMMLDGPPPPGIM